jgi:hypothetical protein
LLKKHKLSLTKIFEETMKCTLASCVAKPV